MLQRGRFLGNRRSEEKLKKQQGRGSNWDGTEKEKKIESGKERKGTRKSLETKAVIN